MFKFIALIKRKQGMSRQEFIDYYENHHAKLGPSMFPDIFAKCRLYRRNYLVFDDPFPSDAAYKDRQTTAGFDVVTECMFDTREEAEALFSAATRTPEKAKIIQADGERFVENHAQMYIVEAHETNF